MTVIGVVVDAFDRVTDKDFVVPVVTVPNASDVGETPSDAGGRAPVPESATVTLGLLASLAITTEPLADPATVGANFTVNVVLAETPMVNGNVLPVTE